jgi:Fe/S biogenesis protein NfuA
MTSEPHQGPAPLLTLTDEARQRVEGFRAGAPDPERQAMWVEVTGTADGEYTYKMSLLPVDAAGRQDAVHDAGGLLVVVPAASVDRVRGGTIEWVDDGAGGGGLKLDNPNKPSALPPPASMPALPMASPMAGGPRPAPMAPPMRPPPVAPAPPPAGDLHGELAQRVIEILERDVNPAIAAHGGRADLVAVEEDAAYLRLSGGCQGCGMATVTLGQGIEVAITEAVPEIERVVDVTDHASGTNPYFEPAKK